MAQLARIVRLDESDDRVFEHPAQMGEWALSGAFEFSNWTAEDLSGKQRQAFSNGWLGLESFGRASIIAVTPITEAELDQLADALAEHFVERYGAPNKEAARPVAVEELKHATDLCDEHPPNTLLLVERSLEDVGVRERFRAVAPQAASIESFAVHGE
ncbi:MAG: DUF6505 family protein [Pseudomonadota bacterium]